MTNRITTGRLTAAFIAVTAAALTASVQQTTSSTSTPTTTTQTAPAPPGQMRTFTPAEMEAMRASMPDGPARDLTIRVCAQCHEPNRAAALRLTREGWEAVVQKMTVLGARATDAELAQITDYLSENFKGEAPKPINLNSATSVDLESVAGLLRKEAAAWIDYRAKHGGCNTLEDLKKVPGVPFKKIDERRDRLVCLILNPQPPQ
jgi:competence protein ComEA